MSKRYSCTVVGCPRSFASCNAFQRHLDEHRTLRRDVLLAALLTRSKLLPGPAIDLCAQFVGQESALKILKIRHEDLDKRSLAAAPLIPAMSYPVTKIMRVSIVRATLSWEFLQCVEAKRTLERLISRLVTAFNGRGHLAHAAQRQAACDEMIELMFTLMGRWNHRGLH
jgi:hypothetical protein